jgi:predicted phosphate transport protein (TIGR00153 family)
MDRQHIPATIADALPHSPFKMLKAHFELTLEAVHKMRKMIAVYCEGEFSEAEQLSVEISNLEHEADEVKRHMRTSMPRMFFMPVAKQDLLDLLTHNERIADAAQDVAQILDMRRTEVPEELKPLLKRFVVNVVESVEALGRMMSSFETILESTFARDEVREVVEMSHEVHEHEYKADVAGKELAKAIYALEGRVSPVTITHLMRFSDVIDNVADQAENAALRMALIVSK